MSDSSSRRVPVWAWLVAALVVLVAGAWAAVAALLPPARVHALVSAQLARSLARETRFSDARVALWPPVRLRVTQPELAEAGGFGHGTVFSAAALDLDLDVFALLARTVRVSRLELEEPRLHVVLRADGTTNLDGIGATGAPSAGAKPAEMNLDVRVFAIRGGRVLVDDLRAARRTAFALDTRTSLLAEAGGSRVATGGETRVSGLAFGPLSARSAGELNQGLAKLVWTVRHRGKYDARVHRLALEQLALAFGRSTIACSGVIDDPGPRARFDLRAKGDGLELGDLLAWIAVADAKAVHGLSGRGRLAFDLGARGPGAPGALPALTGTLALRDGAFRYAGAPAEVGAVSLTARFSPDTVTVPDLAATIAGQPLRGRVRLWRLADPQVDFAVRGDLDLAAVAPLVAPAGTKLAGRTRLDVSGRGPAKDPGALALDGRADLAGVSVESPGLPSRIEGVNGVVLLSQQRAELRQLTARAGHSSLTLSANVARPLALLAPPGKVAPAAVSFALVSPYLDLGELLPTTPGAPFLPNATGGGKVSIARLRQGRLDVSDVTADVTLEPATLVAPAFALKGYGGTLQGNARFDLRDTRQPAFAVHADARDVSADGLLSAWTPARNLLQGALNTTIDLSGRGKTPRDLARTLTAIGLASVAQGQLGPGPTLEALAGFVRVPQMRTIKFRDLKLPFRVERGRVMTDDVSLSGPSGDWKLSGDVGFDGTLDYAVSATLPPEVAGALQARSALAAGALSDDQGRVLLDLRVTGPARAPRVAWDPQAMRDRLAGRASQALAAERAKLAEQAKQAAQQTLLERLGAARDSARGQQAPPVDADSLRRAAGGLLRSFFGPKPPAPPPAQPANADTTHH